MITITKTNLDGVLLIKPDVFEDHRGQYVELYNKALYRSQGIGAKFVQDDISVSSRHVLRGIHGDDETWKLVSCLYGEFYLVVVHCGNGFGRTKFGEWQAFTLSGVNRLQVLIPPFYGNGHLVLSETAIFFYKQSEYYKPRNQFTYRYDDCKFNIQWPVMDPILSQRDRG